MSVQHRCVCGIHYAGKRCFYIPLLLLYCRNLITSPPPPSPRDAFSMGNMEHSQPLLLELLVCLTVHWSEGSQSCWLSRTFHGRMGYIGLRPFIWVNKEQISTYCHTRGLGECLFLWEKPNRQAPNSRKQQKFFFKFRGNIRDRYLVGIWGPQLLALISVPKVHCEPK